MGVSRSRDSRFVMGRWFMRSRVLSSLAALGMVAGTLALAPASAEAQAAARTARPAAPKAYATPKTPWGDPDLRGIYNNATGTPLQRPNKFGERDVLTDAEAEGLEEEAKAGIDAAPRPDYPTGNYNDFWFDPRRRQLTGDKRTSLIVDPPDGRIPALLPLSPEREKARQTAFDANQRFLEGKPSAWPEADTALRCITRTDRPPYMPFAYNSNFQIFQGPGYVAIAAEMIHSTRIIPLDGRPHLGPTIQNWLGDTRGHWEGSTLVLDTTNFRQEGVYGYAAAGYSTNASGTVAQTPVAAVPATYHLTERFTRIGPDLVDYEFTVSDPQTWVRPWTAMIPWKKMDDQGAEYQVYEYACHEDNYDAVHLLLGGRTREKAEQSNQGTARAGAPNR
jgi:hypothetical protein